MGRIFAVDGIIRRHVPLHVLTTFFLMGVSVAYVTNHVH